MALFQSLLTFHSLVFLLWVQEAAAAAAAVQVQMITATDKPDCQDKCGNLSIPYPFGIGDGCSISPFFDINCNETFNPPKPFYGELDLLDMSLLDGEMKVNVYLATDSSNNTADQDATASLGKFTFSDTRNKFVAIGCDTIAYLKGRENGTYGTGCLSLCDSIDDVINGSCNGIGCCQAIIPKGLTEYAATVKSAKNLRRNFTFNPRSYAFLAEENWFNFSSSDLREFNQGKDIVPVVLEWTIGEESCDDAKRNLTAYACGANTDCYEPHNAPGYRCNCSRGYQGNPYLKHGCQDVDECNKTLYPTNPCKGPLEMCINTVGGFNCICQVGYERRKDTLDCVRPDHQNLLNKIIIGTGIGFLFLLMMGTWLYWGYRKIKLMKLKEKFFQQNGGLVLKQLLQRDQEAVGSRTTRIFTAEELERATNKYDESQILGRGGYGTVYKGTLSNGNVVAIKKSKIVDKTQIDQFINEVLVLSQINHRNVVKLLGCCLETEVPLLVYEYITNGTLSEHLHDRENQSVASLSWDNRLRIAVEVAGSLAYLHSWASVPIIHRDVKSSNILLDDSYTAKVSDFGASRLVPIDQTELTTLVQGTLGYLDPEYFQTSTLTDKSDVYSFGVLLAELLTGKMALCFARPEGERSLANYFLSSVKEDRLLHILDGSLVNNDMMSSTTSDEHQLQQVAELAKGCLSVNGEKRPTMKEVAMVLDGLRSSSSKHPWAFDVDAKVLMNNNKEESVSLLGEIQMESYTTDSTVVGGYDSMNNQVLSSLNLGR